VSKDNSPIILAFSGGLDTSFCVPWLAETYGRPVVTLTVDTGSIDDATARMLEQRSRELGAVAHHLVDARGAYFEQVIRFLIMGNVRRGNLYPLCVGAERVLQAQTVAQWARKLGTDVVAHGSTAAGNDQVRFELAAYALDPQIRVIAPWREWDLTSRTRLIAYAEQHQIPVAKDKRGEAPFSVDANLLHISAEGKVLEDPWQEPEEFVYSRTVSPEAAPDKPTYVEIDFAHGDPVAIDGEKL